MTIYFAHCRNLKNTGDMASCPYIYFKDYFDQYHCEFISIGYDDQPVPTKEDIVIIGGGGLIDSCAGWNTHINTLIEQAGLAIMWGAGSNRNEASCFTNKYLTKINFEAMCAVGLRDYIHNPYNYIPCASCLSKEFDGELPVVREIGFVSHYLVTNWIPADTKFLTNTETLPVIVNYMKESGVIVSNSYHMCYWASLLGKPAFRVSGCILDSRFEYAQFRYSEWQLDKEPKPVTPCLKLFRKQNMSFFAEVKKNIEEFMKCR